MIKGVIQRLNTILELIDRIDQSYREDEAFYGECYDSINLLDEPDLTECISVFNQFMLKASKSNFYCDFQLTTKTFHIENECLYECHALTNPIIIQHAHLQFEDIKALFTFVDNNNDEWDKYTIVRNVFDHCGYIDIEKTENKKEYHIIVQDSNDSDVIKKYVIIKCNLLQILETMLENERV